MTKPQVTHINTLHATLDQVIADLTAGNTKTAIAKEINNAAGKRIMAFRTQLEYYKLRQQKPSIPALT